MLFKADIIMQLSLYRVTNRRKFNYEMRLKTSLVIGQLKRSFRKSSTEMFKDHITCILESDEIVSYRVLQIYRKYVLHLLRYTANT